MSFDGTREKFKADLISKSSHLIPALPLLPSLRTKLHKSIANPHRHFISSHKIKVSFFFSFIVRAMFFGSNNLNFFRSAA